MIDTGTRLPSFSLSNQDGTLKSLDSYAGKWLVLYVYPQDDTPGCTIQNKAMTQTKAEFEAANIAVVGLSADDEASHKAFCAKYSLAVELLADPSEAFLKSLGIGQTEWKGKMYWQRTTFVVDPTGVVRKVYLNVDPNGHERVLLKDVRELMALGS